MEASPAQRASAGRVAASLRDSDDVSLEPLAAAGPLAHGAPGRQAAESAPTRSPEASLGHGHRPSELLDAAVETAKAAATAEAAGNRAGGDTVEGTGTASGGSGGDARFTAEGAPIGAAASGAGASGQGGVVAGGADAAAGVGPLLASRIQADTYAGVPPEEHVTDARELAARAQVERL